MSGREQLGRQTPHVVIERLDTAWIALNNGKNSLFIIWAEALALCCIEDSPPISNEGVLLVIRANREDNGRLLTFFVHNHLNIHEELHATPEARCDVLYNNSFIPKLGVDYEALDHLVFALLY